MRRITLLYISLCLVVLLWGLNAVASAFYLYWTVWWYDVMMHFLGGVTLGCFALYFMPKISKKTLIAAFSIVMIVSGAWEVFEYVTDISPAQEGANYAADTTQDLVLDAVGSGLVMLYVKRRTL